eukprot:GHUV01018808.1.p2 GENE.GHUV01018808.1~~GHUV01018808.1.p2  ORF type:complete len:109 (+),score=23.21 GHUV01018808.1:299-625(+)
MLSSVIGVRYLVLQIIVFFPTARAAQFHAALARAAGCNCLDLHSRLSQSKRDQAAAAFGGNPTGVLFASDVIARGLDFPDVSLVVQVCALCLVKPGSQVLRGDFQAVA